MAGSAPVFCRKKCYKEVVVGGLPLRFSPARVESLPRTCSGAHPLCGLQSPARNAWACKRTYRAFHSLAILASSPHCALPPQSDWLSCRFTRLTECFILPMIKFNSREDSVSVVSKSGITMFVRISPNCCIFECFSSLLPSL